MDDRTGCDAVRDRLPDRVAGRLEAAEAAEVDRHLAGCGACRAERGLVAAVLEARPEPPPGLAARIRTAVREDRAATAGAAAPRPAPRRRRNALPFRWGVAAAVALLAVGAAVLVRGGLAPSADGLLAAAAETAPTPWPTDDVMVAGAPLLDDLTDEDLTTLLEELGG